MSGQPILRLWTMRLGFALLTVVILFAYLLPLSHIPRQWAGPDILLAFACAWSVRRPEYVPMLVLTALFLLADLLLQRPPGLWALMALIGCEHLRSRALSLRDQSFVAEWIKVSMVMISISIANRAALMITLTEPPNLTLSLFELVQTLLLYPLIVLITHFAMGVRKAVPGDLGHHGIGS